MRDPGEIVFLDAGGWLSGPMLDPASASRFPALSVPCEVREVSAGTPCPLIEADACLARRGAALGGEA